MAASLKALVCFYSCEGNCRELGGVMAKTIGGGIEEIVPRQEIPRWFLAKYLMGGKGSVFKESAELRPFQADLASYDLTIIGTPVWAWNLPPAARSFLAGRDWRGRKTACFVMHRGGGAGRALAAMTDLLRRGGGTVLGAADFIDLRWRNAETTKAKAAEWAGEMLRTAQGEFYPPG